MRSTLGLRSGFIAACLLILLVPGVSSRAAIVSLNFEDLPDLSPVGDFYSSQGIHFQNAISLTSGISLNEFEYPPASGAIVIGDDNAPIEIMWDGTAGLISSWFAYKYKITFTGYGPDGLVVGTYETDQPPLGEPPPEGGPALPVTAYGRISLDFSGVERLTIAGDLDNFYIMDDFSYDWQPVPEPGTWLTGVCISVMCAFSALRRPKWLACWRRNKAV